MRGLHDKGKFRQALGDNGNYANFLAFFQQEIQRVGVESVLKEYLFKGDENAESLMARLFGGMYLTCPTLPCLTKPYCLFIWFWF